MEWLLVLRILRLLLEIAWWALLGQGIMYLLAGRNREQNFVYAIFKTVAGPPRHIARALAPAAVLDRHIGLLAFLLVSIAWLLTTAGMLRLLRPQLSYGDALGLLLFALFARAAALMNALLSAVGLA